MTWIGDVDLRRLRAEVLATLPDRCKVQRSTHTTDSAGCVIEAWATVSDACVCRIDPYLRQTGNGVIAEREAGETHFMLTLAWDVNIADGDRVEMADGRRYEILRLYNTHSSRIVTRAVISGSAA